MLPNIAGFGRKAVPMAKNGPVFCPDPPRAMADQRLSSLDIRVLMAISVHDRFSKNGVGCTASHTRLANLVGCHLKSLSRSIKTLAECGYVGGRANPLNPKSRCYFVIYNEMDEAILKSVKGNEPVTHIGNEAATDATPTGNQLATPLVTNSFRIGNQLEKNAQSIQGDAGYNIFSETVRDHVETEEIDPVETAPVGAKGAFERENGRSVGAILAMIERGIKEPGRTTFPDWWQTYLDDCISDRGSLEYGSPEYGRAFRLAETLAGRAAA
ncbi:MULTISPECIES: helix-turn-helix domain-containing protein [unclassified Mesorhizobium]|uniref:helix-turn-helix domain-containing protein n=1 Tax=unclassified Mesorhizobium TaxID=325217 RepID=UPI0016765040|nr:MULTISPECIES: helix-turn-helix domain-containing protein [unclassified Mesorhizobium]